MRLRVAVFGHEVLVVELCRQDPAELLAEAIAQISSKDEDEPRYFGSATACHIERSPETDNWGEDSIGFGFG